MVCMPLSESRYVGMAQTRVSIHGKTLKVGKNLPLQRYTEIPELLITSSSLLLFLQMVYLKIDKHAHLFFNSFLSGA